MANKPRFKLSAQAAMQAKPYTNGNAKKILRKPTVNSDDPRKKGDGTAETADFLVLKNTMNRDNATSIREVR